MEINTKKAKFLMNDIKETEIPEFLRNTRSVREFHETVEGYQATPLISLEQYAKQVGVKNVYIKDESKRFGLNAFKGLGGVYAISEILKKHSADEFITATDGNHGRGVAWASALYGKKAHVYLPKGSKQCRVDAIRSFGAEAIVTDMCYDDTVRLVYEISREKGWCLVQDTSFLGYEEIPNLIGRGYTTIYEELNDINPTHLFLQCGVGTFAGSILGCFARDGRLPITTIVEPFSAACAYESARAGIPTPVYDGETIMAGLNCGEVSLNVWPVLKAFSRCFAKCSDDVAKEGMRILAKEKIISGESGSAGFAMFNYIIKDAPEVADILGLNENSIVLCINTEGDTDPDNYAEIIKEKTI